MYVGISLITITPLCSKRNKYNNITYFAPIWGFFNVEISKGK